MILPDNDSFACGCLSGYLPFAVFPLCFLLNDWNRRLLFTKYQLHTIWKCCFIIGSQTIFTHSLSLRKVSNNVHCIKTSFYCSHMLLVFGHISNKIRIFSATSHPRNAWCPQSKCDHLLWVYDKWSDGQQLNTVKNEYPLLSGWIYKQKIPRFYSGVCAASSYNTTTLCLKVSARTCHSPILPITDILLLRCLWWVVVFVSRSQSCVISLSRRCQSKPLTFYLDEIASPGHKSGAGPPGDACALCGCGRERRTNCEKAYLTVGWIATPYFMMEMKYYCLPTCKWHIFKR